MDLLKALKFVQGAVAKKDFVPALVHFHVAGGFVRGFNGSLALCSPVEIDLDVKPKAIPFVKAIETCKETIAMSVTPTGRLSIKSGTFKAFVECTPEPYPEVAPEGEVVVPDGGILKALEVLMPFIAEDASRPWARGIVFRGPSAFATNNVILAEYWLGYSFPVEVNIPKSAIVELLRIGEEPERLQVCDNSVTFHYAGGRWLRTQLFDTSWPDLRPILDRCQSAQAAVLPETFWDAVDTVKPFVGGDLSRVFLGDAAVATSEAEGDGATVEVPGLHATGCFNVGHLLSLRNVVKTIDLTTYPDPCPWFGENVRGVIMGMRA